MDSQLVRRPEIDEILHFAVAQNKRGWRRGRSRPKYW